MRSDPAPRQAIIFDLDGTLLDTLEDLADSLNYVLEKEGLPTHTPEKYRFMVGNGLPTLVARALPEGLRIPAHVKPVLRQFIERYRQNLCVKTKPYAGIPEVLEALKKGGLRLAVLSNKAHPQALEVVAHYFPGCFDLVLGLRPEAAAKPDPSGAREILRAFDLKPGQVLYVGDSDVDMETAVAAGLRPVGVAWGFRPRAELLAAGADVILETPADLLRLVHEGT